MAKLQQARQKTGLSQGQFAEKAQINRRTLQEYEAGRKKIEGANIRTILKCAIAANCRIEDIMDDTEVIQFIRDYQKLTNK